MSLDEEMAKLLHIPVSALERDPLIANNFILFGFRKGRPLEGNSRYSVNSYNCRSVEFFDTPELLVAGCSQTFGIGVPTEGTWPSFVAKELGVEYVNTALPGGSTQTIVTNVLAYIRKFGKPKRILMLLPELTRMTVVDADGLIHRRYAGEPPVIRYEDLSFREDPTNAGRPKYSKLPHNWEDILPLQATVAQSMSALTTLIQYCRDTGIELLWSCWDVESMAFYSALALSEHNEDGFYDGFVPLLEDGLTTDEVLCHEDLYAEHGKLFHHAWDRNKNYAGHLSVHRHRHVADSFLGRL